MAVWALGVRESHFRSARKECGACGKLGGDTPLNMNDSALTEHGVSMKTETPDKPEAVLIATHALFKGLPPQYLALLTEVAMLKEFAADEVIFREGDPANRSI